MYRTYVVQLRQDVMRSRRFRDANPCGGNECFYVGSTAHDVEHRFAQHMRGEKSNRGWVTQYGEQLRQDLATGVEYATRAEAEQAEAELAKSLRSQGFSVWSA